MLSNESSFLRGCPGITRRELLRIGGLGVAGLGLPQLLQAHAASSAQRRGHAAGSFGRAKACILLFMWGGPAHQDTWDPKPDAPVEYRGEFQSIATSVSGLRVCEHLPRIAQNAGKLALIRSVTHAETNHNLATHALLTGHPVVASSSERQDWPHYGAVLANLGRGKGPLPPFVSMMPRVSGGPPLAEQSRGRGAGILGPTLEPMRILADASSPHYRVAELSLSVDVPQERFAPRQDLLRQLEGQQRLTENDPRFAAHASQYRRAFSLLGARGVAEAFDLSKEPDKVRDHYGRNVHGQAVLQARRLIEAGVPLVTVYWQNAGTSIMDVYWDTHYQNFVGLKTRLCPLTDMAFSALLEDLEQRGLLDETLVVWTGEFGRTPRVGQGSGAGVDSTGRDHWPGVFTSVLAGGGIRGGVIYGASDRYAAFPAQNPTRPADVAATIYHCLGVGAETQIRDPLARPMHVVTGQPIQALLA